MNFNAEEVLIKKLMVEVAKEVIVLCDYSKFESTAFVNICPLERMDKVIIGKKIKMRISDKIREMDIKVETV